MELADASKENSSNGENKEESSNFFHEDEAANIEFDEYRNEV